MNQLNRIHNISQLKTKCALVRPTFLSIAVSLTAVAFVGSAHATDRGNGNTADGNLALNPNNSGNYNTAIGAETLFSNTSASLSTAVGGLALKYNTTGFENTATGIFALLSNTEGDFNTASGGESLYSNQTGNRNTATGYRALYQNLAGNENTAIGADALLGNYESSGSYNTATGFQALYSIQDGSGNLAGAWQALYANTSGYYNTGLGVSALRQNTTGFQNTATGVNALYNNNGSNNTANGFQALQNNMSGSGNVALGYQAGINLTSGSNNIDVGAFGKAGEASTIRIGEQGTHNSAFIAGIFGRTLARGAKVMIDSTGRLGTEQSSERYKKAIMPMASASEDLLKLKPVTFRYKEELDPDGTPQFGLIAEEVERVDPDLVVRDEEGQITTVRYEAVNAMLLNEFLKEHRKVQELERTARKQTEQITRQQEQIEALAAGLQKVSDQVGLGKPAARLAANQPSVLRALDRCATLRGVDNSVSLRQLTGQAVREIPRSSIINSRVK